MDASLQLRLLADEGNLPPQGEAIKMLKASPLVGKLTGGFAPKPTFAVWRLLALAEIPYAATLPYTQQVLQYVEEKLATSAGFSLTGTADGLLPCYNAMLTEAYCKLGLAKSEAAQAGLGWILQYQPFRRNAPVAWQEKGTQKYGGCLKQTPCYIGVAKAAKALAAYQRATRGEDAAVTRKLEEAMEYILRHHLYQRLSDGKPFNNHALDLAFPASYQLNIVELLELAHATGCTHHPACKDALAYVRGKQLPDGGWKVGYVYSGDGYISFDRRGTPAPWLSHMLSLWTK